ncbi:MAG: hypothetical protein Q8K12_06380 [Thiobacillus sp.]|nr:hypothetical protein [Thiobacillus sp.]
MQTWYVTHTVPVPHGEEQGKGQSLTGFPDKASAITFALNKLDEGLIVVAGTLEGVVPEEHLTCAEIKQLRNSSL